MKQHSDKLSVRQPARKSAARARSFDKAHVETLICSKKHMITHLRLFSK